MYIDYSKLWKLLIDKGLSKTDLMELTGISSRVLAKLSKNETVTTDTIARICTALSCDVGDIMQSVSEKSLSVYGHYKKYGRVTQESEGYQVVAFAIGEQAYNVLVSRASANRSTTIRCGEDQTVYWEQEYPGGHCKIVEKKVLVKPKADPNTVTIVLIKGKPNAIVGLDEGIFLSSRVSRKKDTDVYVMSEAAFKIF